MRRPLIIALFGLILISLLEWGVNNEIGHYSTNQQTNQNQSAAFGGPVFLGLRDGIAWLWHWLHDNHDELLVIFTALLFGVTAYLVKYTRGLLKEAQKQFPHFKDNVDATKTAADAARNQAEYLMSSERAHLGYRDFKVTDMRSTPQRVYPGGKDGGSIDVTMGIQNFGRTPAWVIEGWSQATVTPEALRCEMLNKTMAGFCNPMPILPNAIDVPGTMHLRPDQWDDIISHRRTLYISGGIKYKDIFGKEHYSGFALRYVHPDNEFEPVCIKTHWEYT